MNINEAKYTHTFNNGIVVVSNKPIITSQNRLGTISVRLSEKSGLYKKLKKLVKG